MSNISVAMRARLLLSLLFLLAAGSALSSANAEEGLTDQSAIKSARDALGGYSGFPWYDDESNSIRRLEALPQTDTSARKSKWEYQPINWNLQWLKYLLEALGWLILALVIIVVILALLRAFGVMDFSLPGAQADVEESLRGDIDRVEALPFQLQRPQSDLLAEARRHYESGDYGQAIIYLYSYQLVQLDRHHLIRLTKGKTNRQYLREVRPRPDLWELLRASMITFEDVFFGHHQIDRARFDSCWNRLTEFHQLLEGVAV